jgi:hypothetical protein
MDRAGELSTRWPRHIDSCAACGRALPLRLPHAGETATLWVCTGCGARYDAVLDRSAPEETTRNVRPAQIDFNRDGLVHPPEAIATFVAHLTNQKAATERRASNRHRLAAPVAAVPVDDDFRPVGQPFMATTRDVSTSGLALIHTRAVDAQYLAVELPAVAGKTMQVVMQVLRCRPLGRFYEIAGPFIVRLG